MNKATKGAVAAGAAAVLLLGGLGSLALWQDTESVAGGEINSGQLNFAPVPGTANWTETSVTPNADLGTDPSEFLIVPGDVLVYSTDYVVNWAGDNLLASIRADFTDVVGVDGEALDDQLLTEVSVNGATPLPNGSTVALPLTVSPQTITVAVTITFDIDTAGLIAQNQSVDLNAFTLTLDQVRP